MPGANVVLSPVSDIQVTWSRTPNDGLPAYQKIDEAHASHDDDTTYISTTTTNAVTRVRLAPLPASILTSNRIVARAWVKIDHDFNNISAGIFVDGVHKVSAGIFGGTAGVWLATETIDLSEFISLSRGQVVEVEFSGGVFAGAIYLTSFELVVDYIPTPWISVELASGAWTGVAGAEGKWVQLEPGSGTWTKAA